jgi:hypothetical protein
MFASNAYLLLDRRVGISYSGPATTAWEPDQGLSGAAHALFYLLAFFAPAPIPEDALILRSRLSIQGLPEPLPRVLGNVDDLRGAVRELTRVSLLNVDGADGTIRMHPVVRSVTRGRLVTKDAVTTRTLEAAFLTVLTASAPMSPDDDRMDWALPTLGEPAVVQSESPAVRGLILNQVVRLNRGRRYREAYDLGSVVLDGWRTAFDADPITAGLVAEVGVALDRAE